MPEPICTTRVKVRDLPLLADIGINPDEIGRRQPLVISVDLLLSAADAEALEANQMRRGDSPLSHLRLSLFGDVVLSDRLTLFHQLPIEPSSRI